MKYIRLIRMMIVIVRIAECKKVRAALSLQVQCGLGGKLDYTHHLLVVGNFTHTD